MFIFSTFLIFNNFLSYCIPQKTNISNKIIDSVSILCNSSIIGLSSYLYFNDYISFRTQEICLTYTLSYLIHDTIYKFIKKDKTFYIKLLHHIFAVYSIWKFHNFDKFISLLYISELTNLPLELRHISINLNFNKYYFREIMVFLLYTSFFYLRIYYIPIFYYRNYDLINLNLIDKINLFGIFLLWWYWFILLNKKILEKIKLSLFQKITLFIKDKMKNIQ